MKRVLGLLAVSAFAVAATAASAEDKILAIVVKGLDNPFFEQINQGCQKANARTGGLRLHLPVYRPGFQRR